jgi:hypothetical protein
MEQIDKLNEVAADGEVDVAKGAIKDLRRSWRRPASRSMGISPPGSACR